MDKPQINKSLVYTIVADTMPLEGRDFTLDTMQDSNGDTVLVVTPITAVGRGFVPVLISRLSDKTSGFTIMEGGSSAQELLSIAVIKERIAKEAAEAREGRVRAEEKQGDVLRETLARLSKDKKDADEAAKVRTQLRNNQEALGRMKFAAGKIDELRAEVDSAALELAKKEAAAGRSWAVDVNAPLTTLFDRQDVTEKMRAVEVAISTAAMKLAEAEEFKRQAANTMRQYILPREG